MNGPTNIALLVLVALAAVVAERSFMAPRAFVEVNQETQATTDPLEGEVLSVEAPSSDEAASLMRKAAVKLRSGEVVFATVGGCIISPGQTTRVSKVGPVSNSSYVVAEHGR